MSQGMTEYIKTRLSEVSYDKNYEETKLKIDVEMSFENDKGKIIKGNDLTLVSGTRGTWTIKVTNNEADMGFGSLFDFISLNYSFAHKIQADNPKARDYVSFETKSKAKFHFAENIPGFRQLCKVLILDGQFKKGEYFVIKIGDRSFGSVGSEVYWTATQGKLIVAVDMSGDGKYLSAKVIPESFNIIWHDVVKYVRLLGPTLIKTGDSFDMNLGVFDRNGNVIKDFEGEISFDKDDNLSGLPEKFKFNKSDNGIKIFKNISINEPGVYRTKAMLSCYDDSTDACYRENYTSNPTIAMDNPHNYVYWGDLHAHGWGDCTMYLMHLRTKKVDPYERHIQARDIGRLDFSAIGPMSYPDTNREEIWDAYKDACLASEKENKYVPFLSYEAHPSEGDRNVIFKNTDENIPPNFRIPMLDLDKKYGGRDDVILQVHIGGRPPIWDEYQPDKEKMLEISSGFGNAEWLLQKALKLGYKPTICGCSDLHMGLMGGPRTVETARGRYFKMLNQRDSAFGVGPLTAVISEKLDRANIWKGFMERSTYATSGARMYIDLKCNGKEIGRDIERGPLNINLVCHGTDIIDRVDLICGDYMIHTWEPGSLDFEASHFIEKEDILGDWIYLRVRQKDENYGWTTPIWINNSKPKWNQTDLNINKYKLNNIDSDAISNYPNNENGASKYLDDVIHYLKTEEDYSKFSDITPIGIIEHLTDKCALFTCYYGEKRKMTIRWYYEYEIPKIRLDWGWRDFGTIDDWTGYNL